MTEIAVSRNRSTKILVKLLEDVPQGRGRSGRLLHGEAQPMSLPIPVVGILPEDDNTNRVEGCGVKCIEDLGSGWKDAMSSLFLDEKGLEFSHIGLRKGIP